MSQNRKVALAVPLRLRIYEQNRGQARSPAADKRAARTSGSKLKAVHELKGSGALKRMLDSMQGEYTDLVSRHHASLHRAIERRYQLSVLIAGNEPLLSDFSSIVGKTLAKTQVLRYVLKYTVPDSKKASKYYRRVKPIWDKGGSEDEVYSFLQKEKLQPSKVATARAKKSVATRAATSLGFDLPKLFDVWHLEDPNGGELSSARVGDPIDMRGTVIKNDKGKLTIRVFDFTTLDDFTEDRESLP